MARAKQVAQEGLVNWDMKQLNIGNDRLAKLMFLEQQKSSQKEADRRTAVQAKVKAELREAKRARMGAEEEKRQYWGKRMGMQPAKDDPRRDPLDPLDMRSIEQIVKDQADRENLTRRLRFRIEQHWEARTSKKLKQRKECDERNKREEGDERDRGPWFLSGCDRKDIALGIQLFNVVHAPPTSKAHTKRYTKVMCPRQAIALRARARLPPHADP